MSFEGQARDLQDLLHRLERTKRQRWVTVDDRQALLTTMKTQLAEAERTLNLPAPPGAGHTRGQLIVWTARARGTLTSLEEEGR
jgi:hypothetical protein